MDLKLFLEKVRLKEDKKIKVCEIEIKDIGTVDFQRPSDEYLIEYTKEVASSANIDTDGEISNMDMGKMALAASKLIYNSCSLLRSKEMRAEYNEKKPDEIPLKIFGFTESMDIAGKIMEIFEGVKLEKKLTEKIKN